MMEQEKKRFSEYLSLNNILCAADAADANEVLNLLLAALKRHYPELDMAAAEREVRAREALFSTVISPGLAVPHARIAGLPAPLAALCCTPHGIAAGAGERPVKVTVLLLTPLEEPDLHLQLLSALAADFSDYDKLEKLSALPTPEELLTALQRGEAGSGDGENEMPEYLTAENLMTAPDATLLETDTLAHAIRTFATTRCEELPVLDSVGDLRGVLSLADILRYSLPEHLLWLENLSPIYHFQPFTDLLKNAEETKVADLMREDFLTAEASEPAVQLAKLFLASKLPQLLITRHGKFAGIVEMKSFCARLFWE